jgi:DHA1 family bicyclomycin/chloramphenicol resistance-like MFS transporter
VVRDMSTGAAASRLLSSLMLVTGLGPILAPVVGGQLLALTSWEGIFLLLTVLSGLLALLVVVALPETLPAERRSHAGLARTVQTMGDLLRDRAFLGYALAGGLTFGALFAYISGSSFVLQRIYGLSPQLFSLAFAMNGLGLIAASQVNAHIVERFGPKRLLRGALVCVVASSGVLLTVVLIGGLPVWALLGPMFVIVSSIPFVLPNTTALALADHAGVAGTASALLGVTQFMVGAIAAPLVGVAGPDSAVPMGVVMVVLALGGLVAFQSAGRRQPWRIAR